MGGAVGATAEESLIRYLRQAPAPSRLTLRRNTAEHRRLALWRGEYRDESVFRHGLLQQWNSGAIDGRTKFRLHVCKLERGLSGSANPQAVTMSGPLTVTANFQCSGPPQSNFLTGYALNGPRLRNDFGGWVGMKLTMGPNPLGVSAVGRICVAGNSGTHTVKFVNASTGTDVAGGSVSVNLSGCTAGQFVYASLAGRDHFAGGTRLLSGQPG